MQPRQNFGQTFKTAARVSGWDTAAPNETPEILTDMMARATWSM